MNMKIRTFVILFGVAAFIGTFTQCTPFNGFNKTIDCGPGFEYDQTASACVPEGNFCDPICDSDHKCIDKVCVSRLKPDPRVIQECAVACGDGHICQNNTCVPAPCNPPCQAGSVCSHGACAPEEECHPPCQQTGYVCEKGLCQAICAQKCPEGTECTGGTCQKPCKPECTDGNFCNDGKCQKLEDFDKDGFRSDRDCNDKDIDINPGAVEACNGKDNDCDGQIDNISPKECYEGPTNTLGIGTCASGRTTCIAGKQTCDGQVQPASQEVCGNSLDDDCNGQVDDGCP